MIVNEFDIFCTPISPDEADPPLGIHPDAVLSTTVADQLLKAVSRRDQQILKNLRSVKHLELAKRRPLQLPVNTLDVLLMPDALGIATAERSDHDSIV